MRLSDYLQYFSCIVDNPKQNLSLLFWIDVNGVCIVPSIKIEYKNVPNVTPILSKEFDVDLIGVMKVIVQL